MGLFSFIFQSNFVTYALLPFIGAALFALGYPTPFFPEIPQGHVLTIVCPIVGLYLLLRATSCLQDRDHAPTRLQESIALLSFSLGIYSVGIYWVPGSIQVFSAMPPAMVHVLSMLIGVFFCSQYWVFGALHRTLHERTGLWMRLKRHPYAIAACYALLLSATEYFLNVYFPAHAGIPWGRLAPHLGLAPFIGAIGFSFASCLAAFSLVARERLALSLWPCLVFMLSFLAINAVFKLTPPQLTAEQTRTTRIRLVQGNIDRELKHEAEMCDNSAVAQVYEKYETHSLAPSSLAGPIDLIVWPETSYPLPLKSDLLLKKEMIIPEFLSDIITRSQSELLVGAFDDPSSEARPDAGQSPLEKQYNAAFLFDRQHHLKGVYHKNILMPIGEELPVEGLYQLLSDYTHNVSRLKHGKNSTRFTLANGMQFITLICFESVLSQMIRRHINQFDDVHVIINISNDSWFAGTIQPVQNMLFAIWPAMEYARPVLRAATTGITAVVNADGTLASQIPYGEAGHLDVAMTTPLQAPKTFYQRFGFLGVLIMAMAFISMYFLTIKRRL